MFDEPPDSLRSLICALDIVFLLLSVAAVYIPLIWRSWTYEKRKIYRGDLSIARLIVVVSLYRFAGLIYSFGLLIIDPERHTLCLRLVLALVMCPLDLKLMRFAWKTCSEVSAMCLDPTLATGPQQPSSSKATPPRSRQIIAIVPHPWPVGYTKKNNSYEGWSFGCCLFFVLFIVFPGVIITGISLHQTRRDRYWAAILMYLIPMALTILVYRLSCSTCLQCRGTSFVERVGEVFWDAWMPGSMIGVIIYFIVFVVDMKSRKEHIKDMTDVWLQLAEALAGYGG
ncbi:hypothetical protein FSARC_5623 [Fusarium sarcochroum]|uniref:Uncharacterized protein n=1 Tax=Fusarium sarcochroum TaxID=1208366 RepID=A0A8H4X998_9HYPO|nr:hypothetical protein FSARC_5623 [Fusarium sarcochroum]